MADRPIVVGVDGTTTALRAVAWAASEALLRGRPLRLVHAAPYLGTPDDPDGPRSGRAPSLGPRPDRRPSDRARTDHGRRRAA